ncbi:MAG: alanyl-tRNA editing protein [Candidatus Altiarchaeota archaeon]|nr:alanyl-tRNA editing protein [Candidatus Altiarchaeota archaeon]
MTVLLHMKDNYVKEFDATVVKLTETGVVLDQTAFYPLGGGVDGDTGTLTVNKTKLKVSGTVWQDGQVVHLLKDMSLFKPGTSVHGKLDWDRRHKIMRTHTAAHLLEAIIFKQTGALIGSGRVDLKSSYLGFTIEQMDKQLIEQAVETANQLIKKGAKVAIYFMDRTEALKAPEMVKLAGKMPPELNELRIVEITELDRQACGGPHVADISELKEIKLVKMKNKGKANRRLYYQVI